MSTKVWIPHPEEGYVAATATGQVQEKKNLKGVTKLIMFKTDSGEIGLSPEQMKEVVDVDDEHYGALPDVTTIRNVTNAAVLQTLKDRYAKNQMYTFIDTIIVSCNPFQRLNLETAENMDNFAHAEDPRDHEPHVYAIGKWALDGCRIDRKNQAILISGESGAGKTEACKILVGFFADCAASKSGVQDRIMQCNPILEALGNAKTSRNNNSSRFGKWTALHFDNAGNIAGAALVDYLLEKSRVLAQSSLERDFHIFYMLVYCDANKYKLPADPKSCGFLKNGSAKADGFDDKAEYQEVLQALEDCLMPADQKEQFLKILAGILLLGNITFKDTGNDTSKFSTGGAEAAAALDVDKAVLEKACVSNRLQIGNEITIKGLKVLDASNARDGLATLVYSRMFTWVIQYLNKVIAGDHDQSAAGGRADEIGLLDIAGFESFTFNTWEQFTINLSNENLQQHFNHYVFKREIPEYKAEEVPFEDIAFTDNQEILDTIAAPTDSIMSICDEESKGMPSENAKADKKLIDKLNKIMGDKKNKWYTPDKFGRTEFTLLHYAGPVKYDVTKWVNEKNKDEPPPLAVEVLSTTKNPLLKIIADGLAEEGRRQKATVSKLFRDSLKVLINKINSAEPHFVRCIKPNDEKKPNIFTKKKVLEQLVYSGVMELVKIRRQGYPYRASPEEFLKKYRCCIPVPLRVAAEKKVGKKLAATSPDRAIVKEILAGMADAFRQPELKIEYQMGKTKVMIRMKGLNLLDEQARYAKIAKAIIIQKIYRGFAVRKKMKRSRELKKLISAFMKQYPLYSGPNTSGMSLMKDVATMKKNKDQANAWVRECEGITFVKVADATFLGAVMKLEKEYAVYKDAGDLRKSFDIMALEKAVGELTALKIEDAIIKEMSERLKKLVTQVPLMNGIKALKLPLNPADLVSCKRAKLIVEQLEKHGLDKGQDTWLQEGAFKYASRVLKEWDNVKGKLDLAALDNLDEQTEQQKIVVNQIRKKMDAAKASGNKKEVEALTRFKKLVAAGRKMTVVKQIDPKFLEALNEAVTTYDFAEIEKHIKGCLENGVSPEDIAEQRQLMNKLRDPEFVGALLGKTVKALKAEKDEKKKLQLITACTNLMKAGKDAGCDQELLTISDRAVKAATRGENMGGTEAQMQLINLYGDFSKFENMNPTVVKPVYLDDGAKVMPMEPDGALSWSKYKLNGTLTNIDNPKHVTTVLSAFRNILGWMTDHPVDEKRRAPLAYAIVWKARDQRDEICTEIYAQVMKQINNNPRHRSRLLGWKLMVFLCKLAQPIPNFKNYVDAFLLRYELEYRGLSDERSREIFNVVKHCKELLERWGKAGVDDGDEAAPTGDTEMKVEVYTCESFDLIAEKEIRKPMIIKMLAKDKMRLLNKKAISAFMLSTDVDHFQVFRVDMDEPPPFEASVGKVCNQNKMVLKKRMLRPKEKVQSGDMGFSDMIVGQAVSDFYYYAVPEEESRIAKVSAANAFFRRNDGGAPVINETTIEALVPKRCLREKSKGEWVKLVQKSYETDWKKEEEKPKLERVCRVLKAHQNLKAFASRQFPCVHKVGFKPEGLDGVSKVCVETITDLGAEAMLMAITCNDVTMFDIRDGKHLAKFGIGAAAHKYKIKAWAATKNRVSLAINIPGKNVYMVLESEKADAIVKFLDRMEEEENGIKEGKDKSDKKDEREKRKSGK
ncbi:unnamed protein product [Amoebophrya sp. A120]|nr:unnamed protein product [Amoebophrya sp. A120]|eukprot:GSA120T00001728001.1